MSKHYFGLVKICNAFVGYDQNGRGLCCNKPRCEEAEAGRRLLCLEHWQALQTDRARDASADEKTPQGIGGARPIDRGTEAAEAPGRAMTTRSEAEMRQLFYLTLGDGHNLLAKQVRFHVAKVVGAIADGSAAAEAMHRREIDRLLDQYAREREICSALRQTATDRAKARRVF